MKLVRYIHSRLVPVLALTMLMGSILAFAPVTSAFAQTSCSSADSDPDGDGWGWENNASCRVVEGSGENTSTNSGAVCVDSDGDGWGWDGSSSCRVVATAPTPSAPTSPTETPICRSLATVGGNGWGFENGVSCKELRAVTDVSLVASRFGSHPTWRISFVDDHNLSVLGWKITRDGVEWRTIGRTPGQTEYFFVDLQEVGLVYGIEPIVAGGGMEYTEVVSVVAPFDGPESVAQPLDSRVRQIFNSGSGNSSTGNEAWRDNPAGSAADQAVQAFDDATMAVEAAENDYEAAQAAYSEAWEGLGLSPEISVGGDGVSVTIGMQIPVGEIYSRYQDLQEETEDFEQAQVDQLNAAGQISSCRSGSSSCRYSDPVVVSPGGGGGGGGGGPTIPREDEPGPCEGSMDAAANC